MKTPKISKPPAPATGGDAEIPLRGSREATLGATGLSRPISTVPAHAPDETRPPFYGESAPQQSSPPEPRASREASLGGAVPDTTPGGGLAAEDEELPYGAAPGAPDPERNWRDDAV